MAASDLFLHRHIFKITKCLNIIYSICNNLDKINNVIEINKPIYYNYLDEVWDLDPSCLSNQSVLSKSDCLQWAANSSQFSDLSC